MTSPINLANRFVAGVQVSSPVMLHDLAAAIQVVAEAHADGAGRHWASVSKELDAIAFDAAAGGANAPR